MLAGIVEIGKLALFAKYPNWLSLLACQDANQGLNLIITIISHLGTYAMLSGGGAHPISSMGHCIHKRCSSSNMLQARDSNRVSQPWIQWLLLSAWNMTRLWTKITIATCRFCFKNSIKDSGATKCHTKASTMSRFWQPGESTRPSWQRSGFMASL